MAASALSAEALRVRRETSLPTVIRDEISRMLEAGELAPGDWINEAELAARFGVSRGPVREACRGLEQRGLLVFVVNRGMFVREISLQEVAELYEIRSALFALAARLLASSITDDGLAELEALVDRMGAAAEHGDLGAYYPLNLQFHQVILELSGNGRLWAVYQNCIEELHLFRRHALITAERMAQSNSEHRAILAALRNRDVRKASRLTEAHVLGAKMRILGPTAPVPKKK